MSNIVFSLSLLKKINKNYYHYVKRTGLFLRKYVKNIKILQNVMLLKFSQNFPRKNLEGYIYLRENN
jgi:hypothetical protein